jgi:hypothetical protein
MNYLCVKTDSTVENNMASQTVAAPEPDWIADDLEMELTMSDEDEFEFDELEESGDAGEEEELVVEQRTSAASNVPVWRLIEMSREDRFLKRELADFEDYDSFDKFAGEYAGISH